MIITGCVIARDEEKTLGKCLESMTGLIDQLVIVDTGSCDRTIEIAKDYKAEVHYHAWKDDFSQARNYALEQAVGDWIVFLDADEQLQIRNIELKRILASEERDALLCSLYNMKGTGTNEEFSRQGVIRVFKNLKNIRYKRPIHEYLVNNGELRELTWTDYRQAIKIFHTGYSIDSINAKKKVHRNIALLLKELKKDPGDGEINFYLSDIYRLVQDWEKTLFHLEIALLQNRFRREIFRLSSHISRVLTMMASNKFADEDILQAIKEGLHLFPLNAELKACQGIIMARKGMTKEIKVLLETSLKLFREDKAIWSFYDEVQSDVYRLLDGIE